MNAALCDVCNTRPGSRTVPSAGGEAWVCEPCSRSVPPGTRCECRDPKCAGDEGTQCHNEAVRMVSGLAMCEACGARIEAATRKEAGMSALELAKRLRALVSAFELDNCAEVGAATVFTLGDGMDSLITALQERDEKWWEMVREIEKDLRTPQGKILETDVVTSESVMRMCRHVADRLREAREGQVGAREADHG